MKIRTSELIGLSLDWAVALCSGHKPPLLRILRGKAALPDLDDPMVCDYLEYSIDPAQAWPIIEREKIDIMWEPNGKPVVRGSTWINGVFIASYGPTPLIAAMRCYVASKLGDETEIPEEATQK